MSQANEDRHRMFESDEIQQQIQRSATHFIERDYTFERRRSIVSSPSGWDIDVWRTLAEMGLLAMNVPERCGGVEMHAHGTRTVMECFGRGLVVEPYLTSAVVATRAVTLLTPCTSGDELLSRLGCGDAISVLCHYEPRSRFDLDVIEMKAQPDGSGYRLEGVKCTGNGTGAADGFLVSARLGAGIALFHVERSIEDVRVNDRPAYDGQRAAEVVFDRCWIPGSALLEADGLPLIEHAIDFGIAAVCAETVGLIEETIRLTIDHLKTRRQFGKPLATFQVLQHSVADMTIHHELVASMAWMAAEEVMSNERRPRRKALSAAKFVVARAAHFVAQQAIQLHGGMGLSEELEVTHYARRLTAIEQEFGDADYHLEMFCELLDV